MTTASRLSKILADARAGNPYASDIHHPRFLDHDSAILCGLIDGLGNADPNSTDAAWNAGISIGLMIRGEFQKRAKP